MTPVTTQTEALPETEPVNVVLWTAFVGVMLGVGGVAIGAVYRGLTLDAALGFLTLVLRTSLFVSLGLWAEAVLRRAAGGYLSASPRRRIVLHAFWILVMFTALTLVADAFLYAFAGYHVTTGGRILFSDGIDGVGKVMEATGLSPRKVVIAAAAVAVVLAVAIVLSKKSRDLSRRWHGTVTRRTAIVLFLASLGLLLAADGLTARFRDPVLWEQEIRRVPLAFALIKPNTALASFRVSLKKPLARRVDDDALRRAKAGAKPDIYLVVIESLRRDALADRIMPHFSALARQSWTFEHPLSTGNVTHYSWYGLLCGNYPIFFDVAKHDPRAQGSLPLSILRQLGYRVELLATSDTAYQNLEAIVFDTQGALLDRKFHPPGKFVPDRDRQVTDELVRRIREEPAGGRLFLVALDSTHFEYDWGKEFQPPFEPYARRTSVTKPYQEDTKARELLENRYRNSAAWVDTLLGKFLGALAAAGRMESSILIVTGDHGEAFWEHGVGSHGSQLGREQLEVALAMRFPGEAPQHFDGVFSLLDVMPTVLYSLGYDPAGDRVLAGAPLQKRFAAPPSRALTRRGEALSFQGWNEHAFRFVLTYDDQRVLLELDKVNPLESHRLLVKQVTSLKGETEAVSGRGGTDGYRQFLGDLPRIMELLPFLDFE